MSDPTTCQHCQVLFSPDRQGQRFCGAICRDKAKRARLADTIKAYLYRYRKAHTEQAAIYAHKWWVTRGREQARLPRERWWKGKCALCEKEIRAVRPGGQRPITCSPKCKRRLRYVLMGEAAHVEGRDKYYRMKARRPGYYAMIARRRYERKVLSSITDPAIREIRALLLALSRRTNERLSETTRLDTMALESQGTTVAEGLRSGAPSSRHQSSD